MDELAGCEVIRANVAIDAPANLALDLGPLASLRRIEGSLSIGCTGVDSFCTDRSTRSFGLEGLESLAAVESVSLGGLPIQNLSALRGLRELGLSNPAPGGTAPSGTLEIMNCDALTDLGGLEGLASVRSVKLTDNAVLRDISSVAGALGASSELRIGRIQSCEASLASSTRPRSRASRSWRAAS